LVSTRIWARAEAREVVRSVSVAVGAIGFVAAVMAFQGWKDVTLALGGVIAVLAGLLIYQVRRAVTQLHRRSELVSKAAEQAEQHYVEVLWRIVRFVEARDVHMKGHSQRVAALGEQIARRMGLPEERCAALKLAGRLHDLGMIAVPEKILNQRKSLGNGRLNVITKHPVIAYEVLKPLKSLAEVVLPAILYHHERMNGTGYPGRFMGQDIPIEARIIAVADAYDAMTHDRPHRPAMSAVAAMEELLRCTPAGYDPACVDALTELKNLPRLQEALCSARA